MPNDNDNPSHEERIAALEKKVSLLLSTMSMVTNHLMEHDGILEALLQAELLQKEVKKID
jgi:hypothetical protein